MSRHILVIEDNEALAEVLTLHLSDLGARVEVASEGRQGLQMATSGNYDLIILDLGLPELDGIEICRKLRTSGRFTPILMLTSRSSELDRVRGLAVGADDYLTKPFGIPELLARVKAMVRRRAVYDASPERTEGKLNFQGLVIDVQARSVTVGAAAVPLTAREFDLLLHFARAPGRVYTRAELLDLVWGHSSEAYEHTVNSHINRLRAKIEQDPSMPRYIVTVWGIGYKLNAQPE